MNSPKGAKPRLALVSSYKELCANSSYTEFLEKALSEDFDVEVLDLKTNSLMSLRGSIAIQKAEEHIDALCKRVKEFDFVNLHLELGLFGHTVEQVKDRIKRISDASGRLLVTYHKLDIAGDDLAVVYTELLNNLKQRPKQNPYHVLVHLPRDKTSLKVIHNIENATDFPVIFLTEKERQYYIEKANPAAWKKSIGFAENDIIIGRFGFLNAYKDHLIGLRLLKILPEHYKLIFVGGQHPLTLKEKAVDPVVKDLTDFLDENKSLCDRVAFIGNLNDEDFYTAMSNTDFVVVPHYEAWQSASVVASQALELNRPTLLSYNFTFMEYNKYFPDCFEFFNIGNHYELKYKIMNFDQRKLKNVEREAKNYTVDKLVGIYKDIYQSMKDSHPVKISHHKPIAIQAVAPVEMSQSISQPANSFLRQLYNYLPEQLKRPIRLVKKTVNAI